jgi:hypothetical protein
VGRWLGDHADGAVADGVVAPLGVAAPLAGVVGLAGVELVVAQVAKRAPERAAKPVAADTRPAAAQ